MRKPGTITIVIADDNAIFRDGVQTLLRSENNFVVTGEACDGKQLVELAKLKQPDVILTDIVMPELDGIGAVKEINKLLPQIGIIAFSMFDQEQLVIEMMEAGALGYVLKDAGKKQVIDAIYSVKDKKPYYSELISRRMVERIARSSFNPYKNADTPLLTQTEIEIIKGVCEGYTNKEIAAKLKHTKRTIEMYRKRLMDKLKLTSTAALVIYAVKKRIYKIQTE